MKAKNLTQKQKKYIEVLPESKTKKEAALLAGYSHSQSHSIKNVENSIVSTARENGFSAKVSEVFTSDRLIRKMEQLFDSKRCVITEEGTEWIQDNNIQYRTLELILKLRGDLAESVKASVSENGPVTINITYAKIDV